MRAMVLEAIQRPLVERQRERPEPTAEQVLVKVHACGVCRTDLHLVDGELPNPKLPVIPGHEIVGSVVNIGSSVEGLKPGDRVGIPWLGSTCQICSACTRGRENLCDAAAFTGYTLDGGYADYVVADERYCFPLGSSLSDAQAAPLMCAGLIGYRSLSMAGEAERLGLYGFGAAAHIIPAGGVASRAASLRVHPTWGHGGTALRHGARCPLGRWFRRDTARAPRRRYHLRARGQPRSRRSASDSARRKSRLRGYPHE